MSTESKTKVIKDLKAKTILITRDFNAPVADVWRAFTESAWLDQWWGPAPWHAETKHMDFAVGGYWLYAMVSPEGEKHWGRMNYLAIDPQKSFAMEDGFCDEHGILNLAFPVSQGMNIFLPIPGGTRVEMSARYPSEADVEKIIEMGFEQGITICLEQLETILAERVR